MPAARKAKSAPAKRRAPHPVNEKEAIAQLTEDHARVKKLFKQYERMAKDEADPSERRDLALKICAELTAHATAEEELFYPAARAAIEAVDLVDEAEVEHATAKELIAQIQGAEPDQDAHYDAKVKVLGEYINHHVQEEEGALFPKVRRAKVNTVTLGEEIATRKAEILDRMESATA
jgi:hemerythrin superfamily protein